MSVYVLADNYLDPALMASSWVSSEQAQFPVDNLYNRQRRSKVWRSAGYWVVKHVAEPPSYTLYSTKYMRGSEFTPPDQQPFDISLDNGEYTTTSLITALQNKLNDNTDTSSRDSVYTVTRDSSLRFVITSDGSAHENVFSIKPTGTFGESPSLLGMLGFNTTNPNLIDGWRTGALSHTADERRIHLEEWVKWDFGLAMNPKAFVLVGPRNTPIKITPGATLKLQGNETDNWTTPSFSQTLTYNDASIVTLNTAGFHTEPLRYWRLHIDDKTNPLGYVEIGSLYLGDIYAPSRGAVQFPFRSEYIDRSRTVYSEGGQTFSDNRQKTQAFDIEWAGLTVADLELHDYWFNKLGTAQPFFMMFDPDSAMSSSINMLTRYVKFVDAPTSELVSPGNYSMRWRLEEQL